MRYGSILWIHICNSSAREITIIKENIYGHLKRLKWIKSFIEEKNSVLEFGCGTGYMITIQLARLGYFIRGIDIDKKSIDYGKDILREYRLENDILRFSDISECESDFDVIIASEVLEHMETEHINKVLSIIYNKIRHGGKILVTVPNGFGIFELEQFLWKKMGIGKLIKIFWIDKIILYAKSILIGRRDFEEPFCSTLSESPHVQRFTLNSIKDILEKSGFKIISSTGSVLFCGPFSNLLFTGIPMIMRLNNYIGGKFPKIASGYYIAGEKIE